MEVPMPPERADLPHPPLTPSGTVGGLPSRVRTHGSWQQADQNKPVLCSGGSKREEKVEEGWLNSPPPKVNQISCLLPPPPPPPCNRGMNCMMIKNKAKCIISY